MRSQHLPGTALAFFLAIGAASPGYSAPPGQDESAAAARLTSDYRRARLHYEAGRYREAAPIFRDIAENHPKSELAIYAANQLLDCLHLLHEKEQLLQQAERFLAIPELLRDAELKKLLEKIKRSAAAPAGSGR